MHKSDPTLRCHVSLENGSFFERFRCIIIEPIRMLYVTNPFINRLNDVRKQINVESVFTSAGRLLRTSLVLVDTFFGFEVIMINKIKIDLFFFKLAINSFFLKGTTNFTTKYSGNYCLFSCITYNLAIIFITSTIRKSDR